MVLPLPEGPTMETNAPWGMSNDTSRSTARAEVPLWYSLVRSRAESIGMRGSVRGWNGAAATVGGALLAVLTACGGASEQKPTTEASVPAGAAAGTTTESTTAAVPAGVGGARVLIVGTSLTAGLGLDPDSAYPAVLQRLADSSGYAVRVVAAGLSGETSAGALRRIDWLLREPAEVVVIETGANDGLRGLQVDTTRANLVALIGKVRAALPGAQVLLAQMEAPPNLGPQYTRNFRDAFLRVAREEAVTLIPFFLEGVAGNASLNQDDGIHPNAAGARIAARNMWKTLGPVLREAGRRRAAAGGGVG